MLPKYIKVQNFNSYLNEYINFDDWGKLAIVLGRNGAGKSSIIDMITTALFFKVKDTDAKGSNIERLINKKSDFFKVEFCFEMDNNEYIVIREKKKDESQKMQLFINGVNHSGKLLETQKLLNDIIKIDYNTFLDTICMGQGQTGGFMTKTPNERKDIFKQIARLYRYDILEDYTKEKRKDIKKDLDTLQGIIDNLNNRINEEEELIKQKKDLKSKVSDNEQLIAKLEAELEIEISKKAEYEQKVKQTKFLINQKNSLTQQILKLENSIKQGMTLEQDLENKLQNEAEVINNIANIQKIIDDLQNEKLEKSKEQSSLQTKNQLLETEIAQCKKQYSDFKNYDSADCKFCGQKISNEYKTERLKEIMNLGKEKQQLVHNNSDILSKLDNDLKIINLNLNNNKTNLNKLQVMKTEIDQAKIKIENIKTKLIELQSQLTENKNQLSSFKTIDLNIIEEIFNDETLKNNLQRIRLEHQNELTNLSIIKNKLAELEEFKKEKHEKIEELATMQHRYLLLNDLVNAYSKSGIQALIIENLLPQISEEINKYLDLLSNGTLSMKFETQAERKNGDAIETLEIIINGPDGERPYISYSNGERMRIDFAFHIGLSKFLSKRSGAKINFFIIDEGMGTLDDEGKNAFLDVLNQITLIFDKIMIISHIEEIKESFINKVLVYKDPIIGSKIKLIK